MLWTLLILAATLFGSFSKSCKPAHLVFALSSFLSDSLSSVFAQISFSNSSPNYAAVTPCTNPSVFCFLSSLATASAACRQEGPFLWFTDIYSAHWTVPNADGELHKYLLSKCEEIPCNLSIPCVPSEVPARFHAAFMWRFILVGNFGSLPAMIFLLAKVKPQIHMSTGVGYKFSGQMSSWPPPAWKRQKPFLVNTVNSQGRMLCNALSAQPLCTALWRPRSSFCLLEPLVLKPPVCACSPTPTGTNAIPGATWNAFPPYFLSKFVSFLMALEMSLVTFKWYIL